MKKKSNETFSARLNEIGYEKVDEYHCEISSIAATATNKNNY